MKQMIMKSVRVTGTPMTRSEYCTFRGWALPTNEDGTDEGMLINFGFHTAWWPKEIIKPNFVELDESIPEWKASITVEHAELVDRAQKLREFLASEGSSPWFLRSNCV